MGCYCSESRVGLRDPKQDVPEDLLHVMADSSSVPRLTSLLCLIQPVRSPASASPDDFMTAPLRFYGNSSSSQSSS
ncbi:uncharacterized [Tachysurus ichikawai]